MAQPPRPCSVPDCGRAHAARGLCKTHWNRAKAAGLLKAEGDIDPAALAGHRVCPSPEPKPPDALDAALREPEGALRSSHLTERLRSRVERICAQRRVAVDALLSALGGGNQGNVSIWELGGDSVLVAVRALLGLDDPADLPLDRRLAALDALLSAPLLSGDHGDRVLVAVRALLGLDGPAGDLLLESE